jgi:hypothetical protein
MRDITALFDALAETRSTGHGDLAALVDQILAATPGCGNRVLLATWSDTHGPCYECGLPAAYLVPDAHTRTGQPTPPAGPQHKRCALCAAQNAADGEPLQHLFA